MTSVPLVLLTYPSMKFMSETMLYISSHCPSQPPLALMFSHMYKDARTNIGASLLLQLHQELSLASLMPIDYNNVISINSKQAKAGKFYTNVKAFFEDGHEEEMLFKEYFDLDSSAEEDKYILSSITHPTETDKRFYLPYYICRLCTYIISFVVDMEIMDI